MLFLAKAYCTISCKKKLLAISATCAGEVGSKITRSNKDFSCSVQLKVGCREHTRQSVSFLNIMFKFKLPVPECQLICSSSPFHGLAPTCIKTHSLYPYCICTTYSTVQYVSRRISDCSVPRGKIHRVQALSAFLHFAQ